MAVPVSTILARKGAEVHTIPSGAIAEEAVQALSRKGVGALVVSDDERTVRGIVSERDIVRALARDGPGCLSRPVTEVMTADVRTCSPATTCDELMATMTQERVRHVPVLRDGVLAGVVSIGDVVKSRLDELEVQADAMERYVTGSPGVDPSAWPPPSPSDRRA